eukprot:2326747-Prymnesium_polylepis.1
MQTLRVGSGAMLAVRASADSAATDDASAALRAVLARHERVSIAARNSTTSCVLSGDAAQIRRAEAALKAKGVKAKALGVAHGFHSADIEPCLPQLRAAAEKLLQSAAVPAIGDDAVARPKVVSTLSGELLLSTPPASHWVEHARRAVAFQPAVEKAVREWRTTIA